MQHIITIKFLNFGTPEIVAVIYLKFKQRGQTLRVFGQNGANGIAYSEDLDQTAPIGILFAEIYLSLRVITVIKFARIFSGFQENGPRQKERRTGQNETEIRPQYTRYK